MRVIGRAEGACVALKRLVLLWPFTAVLDSCVHVHGKYSILLVRLIFVSYVAHKHRLHKDVLQQEPGQLEAGPVEEERVVPTIFFNSIRMIVLDCKLVLRLCW